MNYSTKLCNPTPWDVKLTYDRGVNINIPAFGHADITMQQMDDFRADKPGSEAVLITLHYHGLFLENPDRPYDNQALEALRRARNAKKSQYDSAVQNLIRTRAGAGIPSNEGALEETIDTMGYLEIQKKVDTLTEQIAKYEKVIGPEREKSTRPQFDPARTILVLDPPREFPSVAAMNFFLEQNPEVAAKHQAFKNQPDAPKKTVEEIFDFDAAKETL